MSRRYNHLNADHLMQYASNISNQPVPLNNEADANVVANIEAHKKTAISSAGSRFFPSGNMARLKRFELLTARFVVRIWIFSYLLILLISISYDTCILFFATRISLFQSQTGANLVTSFMNYIISIYFIYAYNIKNWTISLLLLQ